MQQQRQKELHDRSVATRPARYRSWCSSRKLHHPWTDPHRVLKWLSDINYQVPAHTAPKETDARTLQSAEVICHLPGTAEEGHQVSSFHLDKDGIPSPTLLPGTTLDIIQDELEDTAGGATQQHHSPTTSIVTSPHHAQDAMPDTPRRYLIH